jgi:hypothetical protein
MQNITRDAVAVAKIFTAFGAAIDDAGAKAVAGYVETNFGGC